MVVGRWSWVVGRGSWVSWLVGWYVLTAGTYLHTKEPSDIAERGAPTVGIRLEDLAPHRLHQLWIKTSKTSKTTKTSEVHEGTELIVEIWHWNT